MRVCIDLTPFEMLDRHGGFARYAFYLLRELSHYDDIDLRAVVSSRGPVLRADEALQAVSRLSPAISSWRHRWQRRVALGAELRRHKIDVFHATQPRAAPWAPGCPIVVTAHDIVPVVLPTPRTTSLDLAVRRWIHRRQYQRAHQVIAISQQTRHDLITHLGIAEERVIVVHHGVDIKRFHHLSGFEERRAVRHLHGVSRRFFLCVSSDHPRKNHRRLLDAWFRVSGQIEHDLVIVGHALYSSTFSEVRCAARQHGLQNRFHWLDSVTDDQLPALYRCADACIAPSLYEGFGMTLLESMACGTPVIAAQNGAHEEVGGQAILYFDGANSAELSNLLVDVTSNRRMLEKLRELGLKRAKQMSWAATAAATRNVYRYLLKRDCLR